MNSSAFGAAEIWGLKLGPEWVGTSAKEDIPLPDNVRRYYIASTPHGGGVGGFDVTADGAKPFHKDKLCMYAGGMIPFAKTRAERMANGDPRLSLEERYTDHAGYVAAVKKAVANAVAQKFLLLKDADALTAAADASDQDGITHGTACRLWRR